MGRSRKLSYVHTKIITELKHLNCVVLESGEVGGIYFRWKRKGRNWNANLPLQALIIPPSRSHNLNLDPFLYLPKHTKSLNVT